MVKKYCANWQFWGFWNQRTFVVYSLCVLGLCFADIEVIALEPWQELQRIVAGFISPSVTRAEFLVTAIWQTISFALLGVTAGVVLGFPLALVYQYPLVASICAFVRAIHEIFWALVFLQVFGLSPITGILAIALPFGATFARVFHDILSQSPKSILQAISVEADYLSRYLYGKVMPVISSLIYYCRYRFECALRSSAVLGFIGMPTMGFYLETAFRQGDYGLAAALLMMFIGLIGTIKFWCHRYLLPCYFMLAVILLPDVPPIDGQLIWQFISHDIWPTSVVNYSANYDVNYNTNYSASEALLLNLSQLFTAIVHWFLPIWQQQIMPGIFATLSLSLVALGVTHFLTLAFLPTVLTSMSGYAAYIGRFIGICLRSIPEYALAFVFVLLFGPSMLPAICALALHNSALLVFLLSKQQTQRPMTSNYNYQNINHYGYQIIPQIYPHFMGLLMYRFEVMLRETAIFGIIGIATLGFYVDSSFAEIRYASALVILFFTAVLNIIVDFVGRRFIGQQANSWQQC